MMPERAIDAETTTAPERAMLPETTMGEERASNTETAKVAERAMQAETTRNEERARRKEATTFAKRNTIKGGAPRSAPQGGKGVTTNSTTPHLVFNGRCQGADIRRWFAILLRQYGNIPIMEVK